MRLTIACCATALLLSDCASNAPLQDGRLPPEIGNGIGSQYGNYEMRPAGETRDVAGNRCVTFNWDRPLNKDFAIRYATLSWSSKSIPSG